MSDRERVREIERDRQPGRERKLERERVKKEFNIKNHKRNANDEDNKKLKYYDEKGKKCT